MEDDIVYISYCPKCASIECYEGGVAKCSFCKTVTIPTKYNWIDWLFNMPEEESHKLEKDILTLAKADPQFDKTTYENRLGKEKLMRTPSASSFASNTPKCPICGSTSLSKITLAKKATKIALFGIFGMGDNGKTWKCNNCGSKF